LIKQKIDDLKFKLVVPNSIINT